MEIVGKGKNFLKKKLRFFGTGSLGNDFNCIHNLWQHLSGKSHDHLIIGDPGKSPGTITTESKVRLSGEICLGDRVRTDLLDTRELDMESPSHPE